MKPIAAGATAVGDRWINGDVEALCAASTVAAAREWVNPYLFAPPVAPHIAADEAGVAIEFKRILSAYRALVSRADVVVVEGVGGFCVPLSASTDTSDLARRLRLPVILVVGMRLGCLSHALIAAEAVAARGLTLAGWIANRIDPRMKRPRENIAALVERLPAPLIAEIPFRPRRAAREALLDRRLNTDRIAALAGFSK
jgi:dethiobiotin synthetase